MPTDPATPDPTPPAAPTPVPAPDALDQAIADNAAGPKQATGDTGSVEQHPLPDQIAADKYLAAKKAARRRGKGVSLTKLVPPGTA